MQEELLLQDASIFLTKAALDTKIEAMWLALKAQIERSLATEGMHLPEAITVTPGRTYRGENLHHLPWRALDCPRHFAGADMFCMRTLLVWGRDFSFHFLLGGRWLRHFEGALRANQASIAAQGWSLSLQASPWDWSMESTDFAPLALLASDAFARHLATRDWLKLSMSLPLSHFSAIPQEGALRYAALFKLLQ